MVGEVNRPAPAPRREGMQLLWLSVGEFVEEYKGWQFAIVPQASLAKLEKIVMPLSKLEGVTKSGQVSDKQALKLAEQLKDCIKELCAGLAVVIKDWNFIDEATGELLAPPNGNPEVLEMLDFRLVSACGGLVASYMMGADPKNLPEKSEKEEEG
jgi:hypothetical protein